LDLSKADIVTYCADLLKDCEIIPVSCDTLTNAAALIQRYDFQIFDSIIVAASIEANCTILYSEDMQDGLVIGKLTILNPFG
jgi:predicted nucleic acid-binding protein